MTRSPLFPNGVRRPTSKPIVIFSTWDIVRVPFPYTNRPIEQRRPALIVAVLEQRQAPSLVWALMITSAIHRSWPNDIVISDLSLAGLQAASVVRVAKIATIEAMLAERIGMLSRADRLAVSANLHGALDNAL